MPSSAYEHVLTEARRLPYEEQRKLAEQIVRGLSTAPGQDDRPRWEDFAGSSACPMCGEDAQEWVSRTRAEADKGRIPS